MTNSTSSSAKLTRIRVGGLSPVATDAEVRALFDAYGRVVSYERASAGTGRGGAFAHLAMAPAEAEAAIAALHGHEVGGAPLQLSVGGPTGAQTGPADRHPVSAHPRRTVLPPSERSGRAGR